MKKTYLQIEYGSRGEMVVDGLVKTSAGQISDKLDQLIDNAEDDEEVEYLQEFIHFEEDTNRGFITACEHEELSYTYIDYQMHKQKVDRILEIDQLCQSKQMEWNEGDRLIDDIIYSITH